MIRFNRRCVETPHPATISLRFKIFLDFTRVSDLVLNGSDIQDVPNKMSSSFKFSQTTAVNQPAMGTEEAVWDDAVNQQWLDAGAQYLFFNAADTNGAFIFALVRQSRNGTDAPYIFDFGLLNDSGYGIFTRSNGTAGHTPVGHGGAQTGSAVTEDTGYRNIGFVAEFASIQRIYVNNVQIAEQAITLLDLRSSYINYADTRQSGQGPMCVGVTSKTDGAAVRTFYNGAMKVILIGAGIPTAYHRKLLQKYFNIKLAA